MAYEMLMGLNVFDDAVYSDYRAAMLPILEDFGGGFRYDFKTAEVLKNEGGKSINRVFTIHFADEAARDGFFSDEKYLAVKRQFFEKSVTDITIIAEYSR